jgi:hypothetical protein
LGLLAANLGPHYDWSTRIYVNLLHHGRAWCPVASGGGFDYENCPLTAEGYPVAGNSVVMVFLTDLSDWDAGEYLFECDGDLSGSAIQNYGGGSLGPRVYADGKTTCTLTIAGASDSIIALRINNWPADVGGLKLLAPGYALDTTETYRAEAIAHLSKIDTLRFMDWTETNGSESPWAEVGNQDTDWAGSRAADSGSAWGYKHSLKACLDLCATVEPAIGWVNLPAKATNNYFDGFVAEVQANRPAGTMVVAEYGNELWNNNLGESTAYQDIRTAAFDEASVRAGSDITSLSRSGSTVTAGVTAHGLSNGATVYVQHKTGAFTAGSETITVVDPDTISWTDAGSAGAISHTDDNTFIFLNPTHTLCRSLTTYREPEHPTANYVRIRYMLQRARALWEAVDAAGETAAIKVALGTWMADTFNYTPCLLWAIEEWGDLSAWLYTVTPALYMEPDDQNSGVGGINSVDDVFDKLDDNAANVVLPKALRWNNYLKTLGLRAMGYEAGPHTHGGDGTSTAYIIAAHTDDRMRLRLKSWWQSWRNRGGQELCFFHAGVEKAPTSGNSTWPITYGSFDDDATSPKFQAFEELYEESADAVQEDGVNFGTISYAEVLPASGAFLQQTSTWLLIESTKAVPDISITVAVDAAGDYTLAIDACTNGGGTVAYTASIDGVQVSAGNLPSGSVFVTEPGEAFSTAVTFDAAGEHTLTFHVANASRADWVGLANARLT